MFRKYGIIGLTLIFIAFAMAFYNLGNNSFLNITMFFTTGFWLFTDSIDFCLNKTSILHKIAKKKKIFFWLVMAGILIGLLFDFFGILISNLWEWYYLGEPTYLAAIHYIIDLIWGYGIPILMYYSFFRVVMHLIKREFPKKLGIKLYNKTTNKFFRFLLVIGIISLTTPLILFYIIGQNKLTTNLEFGLALLGIWFILEYVEHKRKEQTFLEDIIKGEWKPVLGIIIAAFLTAIIWEGLNTINPIWNYTNLFWQNIIILGIPLQVILGWIPLYVIYLSFYRAIIKGNDKLWKE